MEIGGQRKIKNLSSTIQYIGRSNRHGRNKERTRCWRRGGLLCVCTGLAKVPWMVFIERGEGGFYRIGLGWVLQN